MKLEYWVVGILIHFAVFFFLAELPFAEYYLAENVSFSLAKKSFGQNRFGTMIFWPTIFFSE